MPAASSPSSSRPTPGRPAQRRRTRAAIVDAAIQLIADGHTPSIDEIAHAAEVSRRTIYMHFATLDQLLIDATAGALSNAMIDAALEQVADSDDPAVRVETLARTMLELAPTALPLGRQLIRLTVTTPENQEADSPKRGYRRIEWIERAIQPLRERLDEEQFERLVSALAIVIGWEAMVVLRDIRDLDLDKEKKTVTWAARALVDAMLTEAHNRA